MCASFKFGAKVVLTFAALTLSDVGFAQSNKENNPSGTWEGTKKFEMSAGEGSVDCSMSGTYSISFQVGATPAGQYNLSLVFWSHNYSGKRSQRNQRYDELCERKARQSEHKILRVYPHERKIPGWYTLHYINSNSGKDIFRCFSLDDPNSARLSYGARDYLPCEHSQEFIILTRK